jgi:Histidine kinase-, DNA gyrase B-, and HSP90-like ATPase
MASSPATKSAPLIKPARNPISRKQVEIVLSRSVAVGSLVFAAQTLPALLAQLHETDPVWSITIIVVLFVGLIVALICSIAVRFVRISQGVVAVFYVVALLSWPFAVLSPHMETDNQWLYYLVTVGTSTAAIAFSTRLAAAYLFVVPSLYGIIRMTPDGGSEEIPHAILDSVYSIILGGAVIIIVTMLRQTSSNVDIAQGTALERYGHAVRHHATEIERVQVDSIVHDSVLTTLISAARAYTPEGMELSAVMAGNAIGYLHDAALVQPDDGSTVRLRMISKRIVDAAAGMAKPFELRVTDVGPRSIPSSVGDAVFASAVQAMVNSVQHAGEAPDIGRWVSVKAVRPGGIEVEVGDTGRGFDVSSVPTERLGVRVSIIERVSNAGGTVNLASTPGKGVVVTVRWPAPQAPGSAVERDTDEELQTENGSVS